MNSNSTETDIPLNVTPISQPIKSRSDSEQTAQSFSYSLRSRNSTSSVGSDGLNQPDDAPPSQPQSGSVSDLQSLDRTTAKKVEANTGTGKTVSTPTRVVAIDCSKSLDRPGDILDDVRTEQISELPTNGAEISTEYDIMSLRNKSNTSQPGTSSATADLNGRHKEDTMTDSDKTSSASANFVTENSKSALS